MIVCVRLPYFAASAIRGAHRLAPDVPLAIVRRNKIVATCAQAAEAGVGVGMTVRQAQGLLSELTLFDDDADVQRRATESLLNALAEFTPLVEYETERTRRKQPKRLPDAQQSVVVYVDLEQLRASDTEALARQMSGVICELFGIIPLLGMANGKFSALAASWASSGALMMIPPGQEAEFLAALPITLLPLDAETYRRLALLGLRTLGQIAALPVDAMLTQFGKQGYGLQMLAQGRDSRSVVPHPFGLIEHVTRSFDEPITRRLMLDALLRSVSLELAARLYAKTCMGRTLTLELRLENGAWRERRVTLRQPITDALHVERALIALLDRVNGLECGVLHLAVTMENLTPFVGHQLDLFAYSAEQRARLTATVESLTARYDVNRFWWIVPADPGARRIEQRYRLRGIHEA